MTEINIDQVPALVTTFQNRWRERDERMDLMVSAVTGDWAVADYNGDTVESRSPNLIQVALEDTAEAASLLPTVRTRPSGTTDSAIEKARKMEQIAVGYLDLSAYDVLTIRTLMDLAGHGFISWVVVMNEETGCPYFQWRDPRTCYPEHGPSTLDSARRVLYIRKLEFTQLPPEHREKIAMRVAEVDSSADADWDSPFYDEKEIELVEIFTETETLVCGLWRTGTGPVPTPGRVYVPVELERFPNALGICQAVVSKRITFDDEPRGQFDQVIDVMTAHIRLMATILDYADQAVYSDVWVKDLIGKMPIGGNAYITLGPQGEIGRLAPAVSSLTVFEELSQLMEGVHVGGRWPKSRPGDIDQSIASAKYLEATAGMMNTAIRTLHLIMQRHLGQALRVAFKLDKVSGRDRTVAGVLRNQQFMIERQRDDIDLEAQVRAEYGIGLGRDPAQSLVLGIQAAGAGLVSTEFVQENFEGITDVEMERMRIDVQQLRDMMFAHLMQGVEAGTVPRSALPRIMKDRQNGEQIADLYEKYIVEPEEEREATLLTSGLDGSLVEPGGPPAPAGAQPPVPPDFAALMGGGGPAPNTANRLNVPLGDGGFAGSEVRT